jgi:hypothetical protein
MAKKNDPLVGLRQELCDAWERWEGRTEKGYVDTQNMLKFYMSISREHPDIADRLPPDRGDEVWQRVKYLLMDHERNVGRG